MRRFFLYLTLVTVTVVATDRLLAAGYDTLYQQMLIGQTGGKINHYLRLPQQPQLVVMGNSRAYYQVIPDSFAVPTYNLSHAGMTQVFHTGLLNVITTANRLPATILLHLDPPQYTDQHDQLNDIQNLKYYYGLDTTVTRYINEISPYEPYKFLLDTYRYNGRVINLIKSGVQSLQTPVAQLGNGYEAIIPTRRDSLMTIKSARRDTTDPKAHFHPERLRYLRQFLTMCRTNHVRVIAFTSPLYVRPAQELATCRELGAFLRAEGVSYIDYVTHPLASVENKPRLWKDSHHLNHAGAQLQSQDLARRVHALLAAPPVATEAPTLGQR